MWREAEEAGGEDESLVSQVRGEVEGLGGQAGREEEGEETRRPSHGHPGVAGSLLSVGVR